MNQPTSFDEMNQNQPRKLRFGGITLNPSPNPYDTNGYNPNDDGSRAAAFDRDRIIPGEFDAFEDLPPLPEDDVAAFVDDTNDSPEIKRIREMQQRIDDLENELARRKRTGGGAKGKKGMKELENLVLNMQREFKLVKQALSEQGARELVRKRNAANPTLPPWHVEYQDFNNDGIPDVIVHNDNHKPMIVNGWTTVRSDYPMKHIYYNQYPTKEARKQVKLEMANELHKDPKLINAYKVYKNTYAKAAMNGDMEKVNKLSEMQQAHYKTPKRTQSLYQQFNSEIFTPVASAVFNELQTKKNVSAMAKACGKIWKILVLNPVAIAGGYGGYDDPNFINKKKDPSCKGAINQKCGEIFNQINQDPNPFYDMVKDNIIAALENRI